MSVAEITLAGVCDARLVDQTCTNAYFTVRMQFKDSAGVAADLDALPVITVVSGRTGVGVFSDSMVNAAGTGNYEVTINLDGYDPGLHTFSAAGELSGVPTRIEGAFDVIEPTREQMLMHIVKSRLHDLEPELYKLDLPVPKWNDNMIFRELRTGLIDLNRKPPMPNANFTFVSAPQDLLIQHAFAQCLLSGAILENWNTYTMGDGSASLTINRAQFLKELGQWALKRYDDEALAWKRSIRPHSRGQGTALFPLSIRRAIGFLPNMKQIFGP